VESGTLNDGKACRKCYTVAESAYWAAEICSFDQVIPDWEDGRGLRDSSYEVSNLTAFSKNVAGEACQITKMVFAQPGNVVSAPLVFNLISVKGGSLPCSATWQPGALGVPREHDDKWVEGICESSKLDLANLQRLD
jgi:hypothetical protein